MTQAKDGVKPNNKVPLLVVGAIAAMILAGLAGSVGLLVLGLLVSLRAPETTPAITPTNNNRIQAWQSFERPDLGFQVDLPGEPNFTPRTTPRGVRMNVFHIRSSDGMFMIFAQSTESGGPPPRQFLNEIQAKGYTDGEKFLQEEFVDLPGAEACKELHFVDRYDELTMIRLVATANAFYQVIWSGSPDDRNSPASRRFLDSFSIVE